MEIIFVETDNNDLAGLDFIEDKDGLYCVNIYHAFNAGDLHISIDQSCLLTIGYDGEERSFQIKRKECEAFQRKINNFWRGESSIKIGLFSIWDEEVKNFLRGCSLRFISVRSKAFDKSADLQRRLIESYIPPPINPIKVKPVVKINRSLQRVLISGDKSFASFKKPLFKIPKLLAEQILLV